MPVGYAAGMERTTLFENDLTEERSADPVTREDQAHLLALDPDVEADDDDEDDDAESEDLDD
jgi:hypothetical protein